MLEPLPQGMHDHRISFAESEAQRDWPSKPTEDSVATQSPTRSWICRRGSLAPVHGGIDRPAPPVCSRFTSTKKTCSAICSPLIAKLPNLSFIQSQFPSDFKIAQITPLLKKQTLDLTNSANYRPSSNLNNISKILERFFLFSYQPFIASSPIFNPHQSAYRQDYSTETAGPAVNTQ